MSTTTERAVAMAYASSGGKAGLVFEIPMGMVDRGANISWLSQCASARCMLEPPHLSHASVQHFCAQILMRLSASSRRLPG